MSNRYHEYLVNTNDVPRTIEEIRDHLNNATSILLTVSDYNDGESSTRDVTFEPKEIPSTGFVVTQGIIQPQNTEATIVKEDDKYLVLVAALNEERLGV